MGVQYCDFKDVDIDEVDALVVGSGFAGGVMARELAERGGKRVLVIGARTHYYEGHGVRRVVHSVRTAAATGASASFS